MVLITDANSEIGAHAGSNLLSDLFKAFDLIESSHKSNFFAPKIHIFFLHANATCSELPSDISTMVRLSYLYN